MNKEKFFKILGKIIEVIFDIGVTFLIVYLHERWCN